MRKKNYIYQYFTCLLQEIHILSGHTPFKPMSFEGQRYFNMMHHSIKMDARLEQNPVCL